MRVAFYTYPSAFQNVGGGEILLMKMKEYVEKEGVSVDLFDIWKGRVENYDLIHVFGSVKDCLALVQVANVRNVKVAISPLWWSDFRRAFFTEGSLRTKADFIIRHATKLLLPKFPSARRRLILASDVVFPNSHIELEQIARQFAAPKENMRVVYNGVDRDFAKDADPTLFRKEAGEASYILGVGRIEPRKNQLTLIRAVKKIPGMRLALIGSPVSGYEDYYARCKKEGLGFTQFWETMPHHDPRLKSAYAGCRLFVLQGWFETPGLVALEAALAGARVVSTAGGSTREYFRDFVDYFDPSSVEDLHRKILKNLDAPKDDRLKVHVLENFTWDKVARETVRFYREALGAV